VAPLASPLPAPALVAPPYLKVGYCKLVYDTVFR
jgi:hypothetical protein